MAGWASADSLERNGVEVHYSAVPSVSLAPQVAKQYAITCSFNRALLNIAVLRPGVAVKAVVTDSVTNFTGQRQDLAVREVREREAIYYLSEPRIADRQTLDFALPVTPEGGASIDVTFRQDFFVDR